MDYRDTLAWQRIAQDSALTNEHAPVQLVQADPQRVGLILSVATPDDVFFSPAPDPGNILLGFHLVGGGDPIILDHAHHGGLVQCEWWISSQVNSVTCLAIELIMDTPPTEFQTAQRRNHAESGVPLHDAARP